MSARRPDAVAVFAVAFLLRIGTVLISSGGAGGNFGYDAGVYYTSADALLHGRWPYADFVLLHPPGIMLAVTPFAALGRATSDHTGFIVANTAFAALGAINATLVLVAARRLGFGRRAALVGGMFYAIWFGAMYAEISIRLEPLGNLAFLCGLVTLLGDRPLARRRALLAGAALGATLVVQIWWIVPVAILLGREFIAGRDSRATRWAVAGAALTAAAVAGPFFVHAPASMWRMVVSEQLGRGRIGQPVQRLGQLSTVWWAVPGVHGAAEAVSAGALGLLVVAAGVAAWRIPRARPLVVLLVAQLLVLGLAPSYFTFYDDYAAPALALVTAGAARAIATGAPRLGWAGPGALAAAAALSAATLVQPVAVVEPFPGAPLARAVRHVRCLMTDSPMALIEVNALSRDLANGCPNWVDVTGRTYGQDNLPRPRPSNPRWQADLLRYLLSGQAILVIRSGTGLSAATWRAIRRHPVLARAGGYTVYLTRGASGRA